MENNSERKPFDLRGESKAYAIESIKLYQHLTEYAQKKEYNHPVSSGFPAGKTQKGGAR